MQRTGRQSSCAAHSPRTAQPTVQPTNLPPCFGSRAARRRYQRHGAGDQLWQHGPPHSGRHPNRRCHQPGCGGWAGAAPPPGVRGPLVFTCCWSRHWAGGAQHRGFCSGPFPWLAAVPEAVWQVKQPLGCGMRLPRNEKPARPGHRGMAELLGLLGWRRTAAQAAHGVPHLPVASRPAWPMGFEGYFVQPW